MTAMVTMSTSQHEQIERLASLLADAKTTVAMLAVAEPSVELLDVLWRLRRASRTLAHMIEELNG